MGSVRYPRTQVQANIIALTQAEREVEPRCSSLPAEVWQTGAAFFLSPYRTHQTLKNSPLHHPIAQEVKRRSKGYRQKGSLSQVKNVSSLS